MSKPQATTATQQWYHVTAIDAADDSQCARAARAARDFAYYLLHMHRPQVAWLERARSDEHATWAWAISTEHGSRPLALKGSSDLHGCALPAHNTVCVRVGLTAVDTASAVLKYAVRLHSVAAGKPEVRFRDLQTLAARLVQLDNDVDAAIRTALHRRWEQLAEEGIEA